MSDSNSTLTKPTFNMAKRKIDEYDDVTSIQSSSKHAKINAAVASLSPVKMGKHSKATYFHGTLTDGNNMIRMVGFDQRMHEEIHKYYKEKESVTISNCEIRPSKLDNDELEVIVRSTSSIQMSPSKFNVPSDISVASQSVTISEIKDLPLFKSISVTAKAIQVHQPEQIFNGKVKQDIQLADYTGAVNLVLWEEDVGMLEQGTSYHISGLQVRTFNNERYLSLPKSSKCEITDDLTDVIATNDSNQKRELRQVTISGIKQLTIRLECIACKKTVEKTSTLLGRCANCNTLQKLENCSRYLHATVLLDEGTSFSTYHVYGDTLSAIASDTPVTEENLLLSAPFNCRISQNQITSVTRD